MPLYIDIHELGKVTAEDVAKAHAADVKLQGQYGVEYLKYWFNESCDEAAMALVRLHDRLVRTALADSDGPEVKHTGGGIMASFVSAVAAIKSATQVARDLASHRQNDPE